MADFAATVMPNVFAKAMEMWEGKTRDQYVAHAETLRALLEQQTARVDYRIDGKKLKTDIGWIDTTDIVAGNIAAECTFDGTEIDSGKKEYEINDGSMAKFTVVESQHDDNYFSDTEALAAGLLRADKEIAEAANKKAIAFLATVLGDHTFANAKWAIDGSDATLATFADTNPDESYIAALTLATQKYMLTNPYMITGDTLWLENWNKMMDGANDNGRGAASKLASMNKYFDVYHFDTVNTPNKELYLLQQGAIAMGTGNIYRTREFDGIQEMVMPSRNVPGMSLDIRMKRTCDGAYTKLAVNVVGRYDFFLHPTLEAAKTGVYRFRTPNA